MKKVYLGIIGGLLLSTFNSFGQSDTLSEDIRLNQVGFYKKGPKEIVVADPKEREFFITSVDLKDTVFAGYLQDTKTWKPSSEQVAKGDFYRFSKSGTYRIAIKGKGYSHPFEIKENVHHNAFKGSVKAFYFQRASIPLEEKYAGIWKRPAGHPDNEVYIHPSAAFGDRKMGDVISSPRGWYDAGDYNKYIVNSGITMHTLFMLYEQYGDYLDTINLNIPESGNDIPDYLDEALWNLRWMLTMQDPQDGGVYHKLTTAGFSGSMMPHMTTNKRYVVKKATGPTLDFAAVMAQAARIFKKFDKQLPGLADSCLTASKKAWEWGQANPNVEYTNAEMSNPPIGTGEYGDKGFSDEQFWSTAELLITTGDKKYLDKLNMNDPYFDVPSWPNVATLGLISLTAHGKDIDGLDYEAVKKKLLQIADPLKRHQKESAYGTPMGISNSNFIWGSNSVAANQGIILIQAYRLTDDKDYLNAAIANIDYLLGRNATTYSFVTAFGDKPPMNIHHRQSNSDGIEAPTPGMLAGGPHNTHMRDCNETRYPSNVPARTYYDRWCSYSTNEIAINWNAPLAYLLGAVEAIKATK